MNQHQATCRQWRGSEARHCGSTHDVHLYIVGPRCSSHTPAALAGDPEATGQYCAPARHYCIAAGTPCPDAPALAGGPGTTTATRPWRLLTTGSRNHHGKAYIWHVMDGYLAEHPNLVVVHGACYPRKRADGTRPDISADWLIHLWCISRGAPDEPHPANWQEHGDAAGPIRNQHMADQGADECAAFPQPGSRGTHDCMKRAKAAGIPVRPWTA